MSRDSSAKYKFIFQTTRRSYVLIPLVNVGVKIFLVANDVGQCIVWENCAEVTRLSNFSSMLNVNFISYLTFFHFSKLHFFQFVTRHVQLRSFIDHHRYCTQSTNILRRDDSCLDYGPQRIVKQNLTSNYDYLQRHSLKTSLPGSLAKAL